MLEGKQVHNGARVEKDLRILATGQPRRGNHGYQFLANVSGGYPPRTDEEKYVSLKGLGLLSFTYIKQMIRTLRRMENPRQEPVEQIWMYPIEQPTEHNDKEAQP